MMTVCLLEMVTLTTVLQGSTLTLELTMTMLSHQNIENEKECIV